MATRPGKWRCLAITPDSPGFDKTELGCAAEWSSESGDTEASVQGS